MFNIDYASLFQNISPELATFLIALLPIAELRAAIPIGIEAFNLPVMTVYFWSVVGNLIPAIFLLLWLEPVARWLMNHSRIFEKFFNWIFNRTRKKFSSRAAKHGTFIALILFVAIPLPITGAWTGSVAAFLFGISFKKALSAITLGVIIAGVIVTLTTVSISAVF